MSTHKYHRLAGALPTLFLTLMLTVAFSSPGQAGRQWTINGPEGGQVYSFASPDATGTLIYAGCDGGVYKSTDAGDHWQFLPNSPAPANLLAVNPLNPDILYAGWPNGVSRSTDGGRTWQLCLNSVHDPAYGGARLPTGLAVDPHGSQNVYATFSNTVQASGGPVHGAFCHSPDGGQTWSETTPDAFGGTVPAKLFTIRSLAVDPFQPNIIYVSAPAGGVSGKWRSQNGGQNFQFVFSDSSQPQGGDNLYAEPDAQGVLYSYGHGVSRSNDWGSNFFNTWAPRANTRAVISHQGMGWAVLSAFDGYGADPNFPYGGVAKGYYAPFSDPWTSFSYGLGNGLDTLSTVVALHPHVPFGAFAGMASGVYRTDTMANNGNWLPRNQGLTNAVVTCLAVAQDPQHTIYAGTLAGGVFKSSDHGKSWQAINQGLVLPDAQKLSGTSLLVNGLAVEWPNYFKIYAATNVGLFRSIDGGAHWLPTAFTRGASSVITDPQLPGVVYARAPDNNGDTYTWRSPDAGQTWAPVGGMNADGNTLVCGPTSLPIYRVGWGLYRLTALNANWELLFNNAISLAIDPRVPTTLYVGTYQNGVYKSIDGGGHWTQLSTSDPPFNFTPQRQVTAIAVDPANSDIYVGLQNGGYKFEGADQTGTRHSGGLWKSSDGGLTWTDLGLPFYRSVNAVLLDQSGAVYCGLQNAGVAALTFRDQGLAAGLELLLGD